MDSNRIHLSDFQYIVRFNDAYHVLNNHIKYGLCGEKTSVRLIFMYSILISAKLAILFKNDERNSSFIKNTSPKLC